MPETKQPPITCAGCQRQFAWKPELAGKRVKCKCGQSISIAGASASPSARPVKKSIPKPSDDPADLDGLFALADDAERAAASLPIEVMDIPAEAPVTKASRAGAAGGGAGKGIPLGYQRGATAQQIQRAKNSAAALVDPIRDIYAPIGILAAGFLLYMGYFIYRYHLPSGAMAPIGIGVVLMTVIKAALLVGFALMAAGPLGVSFGGLWSAVLKLAAIAVFTDGVTSWVDVFVAHISGGFGAGGFFGWGAIGFPVALGLYWGLLIYLFSMDPGDSWMVVALLSVFDRIMRVVILLLLMDVILGWGGIAAPSPSSGSHPAAANTTHASKLATHVDELKEADALIEARKYLDDGHQAILNKPVADWYANGCTKIWFEMSGRDINGRRSAQGLLIEMPEEKTKRAKCFEILKGYYKDAQISFDPADLKDDGDGYLEVEIR